MNASKVEYLKKCGLDCGPNGWTFRCIYPDCNDNFNFTTLLYTHIKDHGREKGACPYCAMKYDDVADLVRHVRYHTGERPYICPFPRCEFARIDKQEIIDHCKESVHVLQNKNLISNQFFRDLKMIPVIASLDILKGAEPPPISRPRCPSAVTGNHSNEPLKKRRRIMPPQRECDEEKCIESEAVSNAPSDEVMVKIEREESITECHVESGGNRKAKVVNEERGKAVQSTDNRIVNESKKQKSQPNGEINDQLRSHQLRQRIVVLELEKMELKATATNEETQRMDLEALLQKHENCKLQMMRNIKNLKRKRKNLHSRLDDVKHKMEEEMKMRVEAQQQMETFAGRLKGKQREAERQKKEIEKLRRQMEDWERNYRHLANVVVSAKCFVDRVG